MDVYINGSLVADDVDDYYASHKVGDSYEITDIKNKDGVYIGVREGSLSGTIGEGGINVRLTYEPWYLTYWDNEPVYLIAMNGWKHLEQKNANVQVSEKNAADPKQIWVMEKQSDGSYMVRNEYDGAYLEADSHDGTVVEGRNVQLKSKEFQLLSCLYSHRNTIVTKEQLFNEVWGDSFYSDSTLNVHIRRLREKIESDPNEPRFIKTVWGTGYILETH